MLIKDKKGATERKHFPTCTYCYNDLFFIFRVGKKTLTAEAGFLFVFKIGVLEVQV